MAFERDELPSRRAAPRPKPLYVLRCPFCGSRPVMDPVYGFIACVDENCFGPQTTATGDDAVVQWNKRCVV